MDGRKAVWWVESTVLLLVGCWERRMAEMMVCMKVDKMAGTMAAEMVGHWGMR
jgi:hypothetical protein